MHKGTRNGTHIPVATNSCLVGLTVHRRELMPGSGTPGSFLGRVRLWILEMIYYHNFAINLRVRAWEGLEDGVWMGKVMQFFSNENILKIILLAL